MFSYRLQKQRYAQLSGEGARLAGGRWNSVGTPCIYTSVLTPMALLEYLGHMEDFGLMPAVPMVILKIDMENLRFASFGNDQLPVGWERPMYSAEAQQLGDGILLKNDWDGLKIPSAILPNEENVVLNLRTQNWNERIVDRISYHPYGT